MVEFTDNSMKVKEAMNEAIIAFLYEAGGELEAKTKRNSSEETYGNVKAQNLWQYKVDESEMEAKVGSTKEAAYWEELGTGEHALNHDGRKGWWVYVEGNDTPRNNQKYYTEDEARDAAAYLRSKGLDAHATNGREPNRPLFRAFNSMSSRLVRRFGQILTERFDG